MSIVFLITEYAITDCVFSWCFFSTWLCVSDSCKRGL